MNRHVARTQVRPTQISGRVQGCPSIARIIWAGILETSEQNNVITVGRRRQLQLQRNMEPTTTAAASSPSPLSPDGVVEYVAGRARAPHTFDAAATQT